MQQLLHPYRVHQGQAWPRLFGESHAVDLSRLNLNQPYNSNIQGG